MYKKLAILGATSALAVTSLGGAAPAIGSSEDDSDGDVVVLRVTSVRTEEQFVDIGDPGFSLGDVFVFSSDLYRDGKKIGRSGAVCTAMSVEELERQCLSTIVLPRGQIVSQGSFATDDLTEYLFPITGGSGAFIGVEGELLARNLDGPSRQRYIITLEE